MRDRFPNALFFTTDLDARYLDPKEQAWARNLIVVSSYGLALHPDLQREIAPFRDSTQTAQFAAVLTALGDTNLAALTHVTPRRFEIGNRTAVDLSMNQFDYKSSQLSHPANGPWLHPLTRVEEYTKANSSYPWFFRRHVAQLVTALAFLAGLVLWHCNNPCKGPPTENEFVLPLGAAVAAAFGLQIVYAQITPSIVGILDLYALLIVLTTATLLVLFRRQLRSIQTRNLPLYELFAVFAAFLGTWMILDRSAPFSAGPKSHWLAPLMILPLFLVAGLWWNIFNHLSKSLRYGKQDVGGKEGAFRLLDLIFNSRKNPVVKFRNAYDAYCKYRGIITSEDQANIFIEFLNEILLNKIKVGQTPARKLPNWFSPTLDRRRFWDGFLDSLPPISLRPTLATTLKVARDARKAGRRRYESRIQTLLLFSLGAVGVAALVYWLVRDIRYDTFLTTDGESFSLTAGTSAWPGLILRWIGCFLSLTFIVVLIQRFCGKHFFYHYT